MLPLKNSLAYSRHIFIIFMLLFGIASVLLGNDTNFDLRNYHFYNGFSFLHQRLSQDIMAGSMQTYLNPLFDVCSYLLIMIQHPKLTAFLLGAIQGINAFIILLIAKKVLAVNQQQSLVFPLLAVCMGLTGAASLSLLGTMTNDMYSTVLVLLALYCYLLSQDEKPARFYFSLSALIIGMAFGLKLTNLCFLLALGVTIVCVERQWVAILLFGCCSVLGFFIVDGTWMYHVYQKFGNPIFPFYNNYFHSAYIPALSFNFTPALASIPLKKILALPYYLALHPNTYASESPLQDPRFALVILLFIVVYLRRALHPDNRTLWAVSIFFMSAYGIWCAEFHVYRYALPLEMLSGILIISFTRSLFATPAFAWLTLFLIIVGLTLFTNPPEWGRTRLQERYFAMQAPTVPNDATIVLLSRPYSYVIPFFNPTAHFIGLPVTGLAAATHLNNDKLLYQNTSHMLLTAAKQNKLYALGYAQDDLVTTLSYALLFAQKIGPTPQCQDFSTNLGNHLRLCKLRLFAAR